MKMEDCKGVATPTTVDFPKGDYSNNPPYSKRAYQSAVGHLLYLAQWSRPDIAYAVNMLS